MIQPWLTFLGLVADVVGFVMLTMDLLPRYLREKEIKMLHSAMHNAECIHVSSTEKDGSRFFVNDQLDLTKRVLTTWKKVGWHVSDYVERNHNSIDVLSESDVDEMLPFINQIVGQRERALEQFDEQPRPPLVVAVAIIAFGYLLQALGALPFVTY